MSNVSILVNRNDSDSDEDCHSGNGSDSEDSWLSFDESGSESSRSRSSDHQAVPGPSDAGSANTRPRSRSKSTPRGGRQPRDGRQPQPARQFQADEWEVLDPDEEFELEEWLPNYDRRRGVLVDTTDFEAIDYFRMFFSDQMLEHIMTETNRYGDSVFREKVNAGGDNIPYRTKQWKHVDFEELSAFIGLQIAMGLCSKSALEDYWEISNWVTYTPFTKVLGRNRYQLIHSCLHFNNNDNRIDRGEVGYDALFKVRPLLDFVVPLCRQAYAPGETLSIDESMVAFKGRIYFKQYLPSKPTKWGLKVFMLADATSFYCHNIIIYTGKSNYVIDDGNTMRSQVVFDLLNGYEDRGHKLFTDNFYTSPALYKKLKEKNIGACGTVLDNTRGYPQQLKKKERKMKRGDPPVFAKSQDLLVATFHDSKRVSVLATVGDNSTTNKRVRDRKSPSGFRNISKPTIAQIYNNYMAGVDHFDQLKGNYNYPHKALKWYFCVFHFLKEVALINGLICFRQKDPSMTAKKFRYLVLNALIRDQVIRRNSTAVAPAPALEERLVGRHFIRSYENKKYKPDCIVCKSVGKRSQTRYFCNVCGIPLCLEYCFECYHKVDNYTAARRRRLQDLANDQ